MLVEPHAAAITFDELTWEQTWTRQGRSRIPIVPSPEVSGVVADAGPGDSGPQLGDQVYGLIQFDHDGAAAEYVAVPGADLAPRPSTVCWFTAASAAWAR